MNRSDEEGFHSPPTERMLIGAILTEARADQHHALLGLLAAEDFYLEQHRSIWKICALLKDTGRAHDAASVLDAASKMGLQIGGAPYLADVLRDPLVKSSSNESLQSAAQRTKGFALTRRMVVALDRARNLAQGGQDFETVHGFLEDELSNLRSISSTSRAGPQHISSYYVTVMDRIAASMDGQANLDVVPTGFPELDRSLGGGLSREQLVVLAGRPGMGKTAFASALEQRISRSGTPTLTFSLEMPGTALAQRNLARGSRVSFTTIKLGGLDDAQLSAITHSADELGEYPSYIDDTPGLTLRDIRSRSRAFAAEHPNCVIFVDYLQKIAPDKEGKDPRLTVGASSAGLLQLARELKCPVVALAQLNRGLESRANKRPIMSDLRESGEIEQDAAVILFLYRDEVYNPESPDRGVTELIEAKNRDAQPVILKYASDLSIMSYTEIGTYSYEQ